MALLVLGMVHRHVHLLVHPQDSPHAMTLLGRQSNPIMMIQMWYVSFILPYYGQIIYCPLDQALHFSWNCLENDFVDELTVWTLIFRLNKNIVGDQPAFKLSMQNLGITSLLRQVQFMPWISNLTLICKCYIVVMKNMRDNSKCWALLVLMLFHSKM